MNRRIAVLSGTIAQAGKVINVIKGKQVTNNRQFDITDITPQPAVGWDYDGAGGFSYAVPEGEKRFRVNITDVKRGITSIQDDDGAYSVQSNDDVTVDFTVTRIQNGTTVNVNRTADFVFKGLFGTTALPIEVVFIAGRGTTTFQFGSTGVFELNEEGINFATRKNPNLQLEFNQTSIFVVK